MGAGASRLLRYPGRQHGKAFLRPVLHQERVHRTGPVDLVSDDKDLAARQRWTMSGGVALTIFWLSAAWLAYIYLGYAACIWLLSVVRPFRRRAGVWDYSPSISCLVCGG